ncbi:anhydro-N-acetylmuramic acid kinase [Cohaesibacter sp. ES.047]|uniref:anhydro-N-acetylmuramic acid kinase n=1 Tax=Cohaesibacter sp. ES.047 TaxID=1798205 RepID=UPI000BBFB502|nr:anhydro-N-acetylmuramic acid kinase [Cohaesibacter sp. ES.047]SNY93776.1 anhydro-N-acetylmuramic acid kinase [Cohaesibacter sp. ES.047]
MAENQKKSILAVGLMSGTSCDGVDAALIESDGEAAVRPIAPAFRPYDGAEQDLLRQALDDARGLEDRDARPGCLPEAEAMITKAHAEAVAQLLAGKGAEGFRPDLVGFHGQTVWHNPAAGVTMQIGDGQALADATGLPVVHDFRAADVDAGGQGAPLVPIYHQALVGASSIPVTPPVAVVNIGGVANITWIGADGGLMAFDSGPGNALINDWVRARADVSMDKGGQIAAKGQVDFLALLGLMGNPYFKREAPKSLDRNAFDIEPVAQLSTEDGAATLTAFTVETICLGLEHMEVRFGGAATMAIICGGGQRNDWMMAQLSEALDMPVMGADALGWRGDALEAEAFAYLAIRSRKGLPLTFPGTTGVAAPMPGGVMAMPADKI